MNAVEKVEYMKRFRDPQAQAKVIAEFKKLPEQLRQLGYELLNLDPRGRPYPRGKTPSGTGMHYAAGRVVNLPDNDRETVLIILFPKIYRVVQRAWALHFERGYLSAGSVTAFKAPTRPEWYTDRLSRWLSQLLRVYLPYREQDIVWIATHSDLFGWGWDSAAAMLLAAAIDIGDEQGELVYQTLLEIGRGNHPQALIGRYLIGTLLNCSHPDAWAFVEQLLLAAQRQEGLRQMILEMVDLAHPEAFRRIVGLVREQNMVRFNSVVRAVDVWLQLGFDVTHTREVEQVLIMLERFLADKGLACRAVSDENSQVGYVALLALGFTDVVEALDLAQGLIEDGSDDQRVMAARFMVLSNCPLGRERLVPLLHDDDRHVMTLALEHLRFSQRPDSLTFAHVEAMLPNLPSKEMDLPPRVWPWWYLKLNPKRAGQLLIKALEGRPLNALFPYSDFLDSYEKRRVIEMLAREKGNWDSEVRGRLIAWLGDRTANVRQAAAQALNNVELDEEECVTLERYLTRKASDLRKNALKILLGQEDSMAFNSAERLLSSGKIAQREAGLELLAKLYEGERMPNRCRQTAAVYAEKRTKLNANEQSLLSQIAPSAEKEAEPVSIEDGLGLFDNSLRTPPLVPKSLDFKPVTKEALNLIQSLDRWVGEHEDEEIRWDRGHGERQIILGAVRYVNQLPRYDLKRSREENLASLPLAESWLRWWEYQRPALEGNGDRDLLRAWMIAGQQITPHNWEQMLSDLLPDDRFYAGLNYRVVVQVYLDWAIHLFEPDQATADFVLEGVSYTNWLLLNASNQTAFWGALYGRGGSTVVWLNCFQWLERAHSNALSNAHHTRFWQLLRWQDEPTLILPEPNKKGLFNRLRAAVSEPVTVETLTRRFLGDQVDQYTRMPRRRPSLDVLMAAYEAGGANDHDLLDLLIGPTNGHYRRLDPNRRTYYFYSGGRQALRRVSTRKPGPRPGKYDFHPAVQAAVEKVRRRIIEVELTRGDLPTPASSSARSLRYTGGAETLIKLLQAFGRELFVRAYAYDGESKKAVFSHLIRATYPGEDETSEMFAALAKQANISEKRLIETAMYAPQWASHIGKTVGWDGLADGVWWFHAHTKDTSWRVEAEIREAWAAEINDQTPLTAQDLVDGAVDVTWFKRVYALLGEKRWKTLHQAAKYASGSGGHKRAQLFAEAMLGKADQAALEKRITTKRYQDGVRALGLLPLPDQQADREEELLARYLFMQEFLRGSKKFGSQRKASEKLAVRIGLENLARTAGFADPLRLEWAMEQQAVADLAEGPVTASFDGVTVTLAIDQLGDPQVTIVRQLKSGKEKPLRSVPSKLKKKPEIAELTGRKTDIRRQASRTRLSLETAMIRGDRFAAAELQDLWRHPVVRPMLQQLVYVRDETGELGFPVMHGRELEGLDREIVRLEPADGLRIAHPQDLLEHDWHLWQKKCFREERIQPFKQIFRELYLITPVEVEAHDRSRRYAGQEVNPRQAHGLFGQRGWVTHPHEGTRKTFHDENITVHVGLLNGILTPAEVGGETIEAVFFTKRGHWQPLPLVDIPPRLFSEAMRDLDLVVSVAHLAGVDPEVTQSSLEFRGSLVRETAELLNLGNVEVKERHVLIEGQLNRYSIHLGSGIIHQRPGGYVCVVPVHNSQRGRVFLPFVDKDPKSAEIIAKTVMLANDKKIKDPTILAQLTSR